MMKTETIRRSFGLGVVAGVFALVGMVPSLALAQNVDSRWLPWLGCWEAGTAGEEVPMLCLSPLQDGQGVELVTWANGEVVSTEAIRTDGVARQADRDGCTGMEEAQFSDDGSRVYLKSSYVCEEGGERSATGLLAMVNPMEWVDIKVVEVGDQRAPWAMRYRLARASRVTEAGVENVVAPRAQAVKNARIAASAPLSLDDVIEASGKVDPEAVESLIVERGERFQVNGDRLIQLADAGVPESVIDLVIAVSYPDRFAVKPGAIEEAQPGPSRAAIPLHYAGGYGYSRWSFWNPYFYDPYYYRYGAYGYSPYAYGGFGYGGYGYGGYYRPTTVIIAPRTSGPTGGGRIVKGRGYTRSSGATSRGTSAGSAPASGGSRGTVSAGSGASRGGSSGSTGRVAKPRGGGGGGI